MTVQIACSCGHSFDSDSLVDGSKVVCPQCGRNITSQGSGGSGASGIDATLVAPSQNASGDEDQSQRGAGSTKDNAAPENPTVVMTSPATDTVVSPALGESAAGQPSEAEDATLVFSEEKPAIDDAAGTVVMSSESDADQTLIEGDASRQAGPGKAGATDATFVQTSDGEISHYEPTIISGPGGSASDALAEIEAKSKQIPDVKKLGHFEVQRILGQGAFGTVYLAYDPRLDRKVAVKVAQTGVLVGKADVDRFLREARSAAQLRHPHIVPVYEVGQIQLTNFIAYEFVEGQTLKAALKKRVKYSVDEAAQLMEKMASALHYAHERGIVHRDMKPDNVMIDLHGEPHIMDFGLARRDEVDTTRTREGTLMGTPAYMSPEQASGESHLADARSDVWSLGIMFDEMLTGILPFQGTVTEVLVAVKQREATPLRQLDPTIPKDIETICLKCLAKDKNERYQTAEELADELGRYLRGEPILARPVSVFDRTWRWARRNPAVAGLLASIVMILAIASIVSTSFGVYATRQRTIARNEQRQRSIEQVKTLQTTEVESVPVILAGLQPFRSDVLPQLNELNEQSDLPDRQQVRVRLALHALDPESPSDAATTDRLYEDLLKAPADEFRVIRDVLKPDAPRLKDRLWDVAQSKEAGADQRFHAASALALYDPHGPGWQNLAGDTTGKLIAASTLELSDWIECLRPVRNSLLPPLESQFRAADRENERQMAAIVVAELYTSDTKLLVDFIRIANDQQLAALLPALSRNVSESVALLRDALRETDHTAVTRGEADAVALQTTNLVMALLSLRNDDEQGWAAMKDGPDQRVRSILVHRMGSVGISPEISTRRLQRESDPIVLAALLLGLGEYGTGTLYASERTDLTPLIIEMYTTHPHPGVHSAAGWLLREWGLADQLHAIDESIRSNVPTANNRWHVNGQGQTMAVIPGPVEFQMGSPPDESGRIEIVGLDATDVEKQYACRIPRTFGISTTEVTVAEYLRFNDLHDFDREYSPDLASPIIAVSWFDAAKYCRWLSEQEGIPEDQMCYPPISKIRPDMTLPENMLERTGYRLPTAAEWEYACRAGTTTSRYYGASDALLPEYAWFFNNATGHAWPVGQLKPNNFGLFDMHGNVIEWCQSQYFDDATDGGKLLTENVLIDGNDDRRGFLYDLRGGCFSDKSPEVRAAYRDSDGAISITFQVGFRVARTYN